MFKNLKLAVKMSFGFSFVLALLVLVACFGFLGISKDLQGIIEYRGLSRENIKASGLYTRLLLCRMDIKEYYITRSEDAVQKYEGDKAKMRQSLQETRKEITDADRLKQLAAFETLFGDYDKNVLEFIALLRKGDNNSKPIQDELSRIGLNLINITDGLETQITDSQVKLGTQFQDRVIRFKIAIAVVSGLAILIGALTAWGLTRAITKPLRAITDDLTTGSYQIASAAGQVAAAGQTLAEGASEQAASLEESSSALEEMASMIKRNAENAQKADALAKRTRKAADTGVSDMDNMSAAMMAIKASGSEIAKIIKTIDEIAFQTNILALNAAVEAARAGESGAGFAVVADEVRNLAQRSAQAAKETAVQIESAISKTEQGVQLSDKVAHGLKEILDTARQVDEFVGEVALASTEQSQGIEQVSIAVSQMDKVTQSNAANAEESASAAEELNAQAEGLKDVVQDLARLVEGNKIQRQPEPAKASEIKTKTSVQTDPAPARRFALKGIIQPSN